MLLATVLYSFYGLMNLIITTPYETDRNNISSSYTSESKPEKWSHLLRSAELAKSSKIRSQPLELRRWPWECVNSAELPNHHAVATQRNTHLVLHF